MTLSITSYLLLSGSGLMFFYLADRLFLRSLSALRYKRTYYLAAIGGSMVLPLLALLIPYDFGEMLLSHDPLEGVHIVIEKPEVAALEAAGEAHPSVIVTLGKVLPFVWLAGILVMLLRLLIGLITATRIISRAERREASEGEVIYITEEERNPFTFMGRIVIPRHLHDSPGFALILGHEQAHARGKHHLDLLLDQACTTLHWWNPFAWGLVSAHRETLEYLADKTVLDSGVARKVYQRQLLESTLKITAESLSLSFSVHNLKKRIMMMNSNDNLSKRTQLWRVSTALAATSLMLLVGSNMMATPSALPVVEESASPTMQVEDSKISSEILDKVPDILPKYPGGEKAMMQFLAKNINYPKEAQEKNLQGKVLISFVVSKTGELKDFKVIKSVHPVLDNEALRVVKLMGKWIPGEVKGEAVETSFTIPVSFKIGANDNKKDSNDKVFEYLETMPQYEGGQSAMMKFLAENIRYPKEAVDKKLQGRAIVGFIVEKDGSITNVEITGSVDPLLDNEAMRVVKLMNKWIPGKDTKGNPVRCRFNLPVNYRLPQKDTADTESDKM